jgi:transcriptional regulator with XRE-family HTH domain
MQKRPTLGSVLAEARKKEKKSLREMSERVLKEDGTPITPQYLNDIEHDRRTPSPAVIERLATVYGFGADYLYHLAGTLPRDLQGKARSEQASIKAWSAFRRQLKDQ